MKFTVIPIVAFVFFLSGCGLVKYPGQPGVKTSASAKIDVEFVTDEGLYVYEIRYDNSETGKGMREIVTLAYPAAKTFTSNVRMNSEGSLYRVERRYEGAQVELLVHPAKKEIIVPKESKVALLLDTDISVDEVDTRNLNEEKIFLPEAPPTPPPRPTPPTRVRFQWPTLRWELLRAARVNRNAPGMLMYQVEKIHFADKTWTPSENILFQTNLSQTGVQVSASESTRKNLVEFIETSFPSGFSGDLGVQLQGVKEPLAIPLKLHTLSTIKSAGYTVKEATREILNQYLSRN